MCIYIYIYTHIVIYDQKQLGSTPSPPSGTLLHRPLWALGERVVARGESGSQENPPPARGEVPPPALRALPLCSQSSQGAPPAVLVPFPTPKAYPLQSPLQSQSSPGQVGETTSREGMKGGDRLFPTSDHICIYIYIYICI